LRLINKSLSQWLRFESGRSFRIGHIQENRFVFTLFGVNTQNKNIQASAIIEEHDNGAFASNVINATIASWLKKANLPE